jgi:ketosteroid isomerase-like protein
MPNDVLRRAGTQFDSSRPRARLLGHNIGITLVLAIAIWLQPSAAVVSGETDAVAALLDDWHAAASEADEQRYFSHFAPQAVFLGTDATERWTVEQFRAYAHPHFSQGRGWTYRPSSRHVMFSNDGTLAWFDEQLDSEKYGKLRGTGVLLKIDADWKLLHYSMTFTIPNEATARVVPLIFSPERADQQED